MHIGDGHLAYLKDKNKCIVDNECAWRISESENAGMCKNKNEAEYTCAIYTNRSKSQCEENEKCYWEPYGDCVDK